MAEAAIAAGLDNHFIALAHVFHTSACCRHNPGGFMARHQREFHILANAFDSLVIRRAKAT